MSVIGFLQSVNPRLVFMLAFISGLAYLMYRDRENVERQSILFYRRTKKGIKLIDNIANRFPRFWKFYGWTGLVMGIISIPFILWNIVLSFSQMTQTGGSTGGPSLIAPGLSGETTFQSGISFIPVEYWVLGIGVLMVVHEMSHGIVARAEGMEVNSVGWIVLGIIPGAFVEPKGEEMLPRDEEENDTEDSGDNTSLGGHWDQGSLSSRLKVLAAGSFANYITAAIMGLTALALFMTVTQPNGVYYQTQEGLPGAEAGMNNGTMYSIGGEPLKYGNEVKTALDQYQINETVKVNTSEGEFNVTLMDRNGSAHMGVMIASGKGPGTAFYDMILDRRNVKPDYESIEGLLTWTLGGLQVIALLNLLIGLFNMLPVRPLDGGQIIGAVIEEYFEDGQKAFNYVSLVVWMFLLGSIALSVITGV